MTLIKKVTGDRDVFLRELQAQFQIPYHDIRIRAGGVIEVKGNYVTAIKLWLTGLGF